MKNNNRHCEKPKQDQNEGRKTLWWPQTIADVADAPCGDHKTGRASLKIQNLYDNWSIQTTQQLINSPTKNELAAAIGNDGRCFF